MSVYELALILRARRTALPVRQYEVAAAMGIAASRLSKLERGYSRWNPGLLSRFESALTRLARSLETR